MVSGYGAFNVCQQLFVTGHHFSVVTQFEINFYHLFQRFEAPFTFLAIFQIEYFLK